MSCLSVTLVYCGQTIGWIEMQLGTEVGIGPGDIVLDGDPAAPHGNGRSSPPPTFAQMTAECSCTLYDGTPRIYIRSTGNVV